MGIYATKSGVQTKLGGVAAWLAARRVSANAITLSAVGVSAFAGLLLAASTRDPALLLSVPPLLLSRLLLNVLDGMVARASNTTHARGELLNEFGDRVSDLLIFGGLAWASDAALGWLTISLILLSSYSDILGKSISGRRTYRGLMAKGDRMLWLAACALIVFFTGAAHWWTIGWWLLLLGALVTTAQRLKGVYDAC